MSTAQLAIIGMPGTGKTTLACALGDMLRLPVLHTDDFKQLPWADQPAAALQQIPARGIVEGVTTARLFRRGFRPDCVVYLIGGTVEYPSILSLLQNGLLDYDKALESERFGGRVLHVPERPSPETVLWLMGTLGPEDA